MLFYSYGIHRDLHSFPTRRSSDLHGGSSRLTRWLGLRRGSVLGLDSRARDRKSTRLNSSHANISYAVFCLKKKILLNHAIVANRYLYLDNQEEAELLAMVVQPIFT